MKTYILYIATLLAALALPANGQTGNTDTKGMPDSPAMPYKLSTTVVGTNHGTLSVADTTGGSGVFFPGSDTLVYGATGKNGTGVKLTVTPDKGCIVRSDGYPKVNKTSDAETVVKLSDKQDDDGVCSWTFRMPGYPVTVEIAYAEQLRSIAAVTLKEEATDEVAAITLLPKYIHITLETGRKDSLEVASWTFLGSGDSGNGAYDPAYGADNRFTATLATDLPAGIVDASTPLFKGKQCAVTVANKAKPLTPETDNKITITDGTGDNLNSNGAAFNGTIESATVKGLEVEENVKDATLTLKDVIVSETGTTIKEGADLTLKIEGTNDLGTLTIQPGATVVLDMGGKASLGKTTIANNGTFCDSTASVTKVTGNVSLDIKGDLKGGGPVTTGRPITLTASTNEGTGTITFTWQKGANGIYTNIPGATKTYENGNLKSGVPGFSNQYTVSAATAGDAAEYRCLIERTVTSSAPDGSETKATTLLSTKPAEVKVNTPTPPPYIPTNYTVILPALEGFTSDPTPGTYSVEEGDSFSFSLTLKEEGTYTTPVVTTSRGETLEPRQSDGKYVVSTVYEDVAITLTTERIEPEEPDDPTGNENIEANGIRIRTVSGAVYIQTPQPTSTIIYTLAGHPVVKQELPAGDSRIELPRGIYIITAGNQHRKLIIR